jgi:hypothetical protein
MEDLFVNEDLRKNKDKKFPYGPETWAAAFSFSNRALRSKKRPGKFPAF